MIKRNYIPHMQHVELTEWEITFMLKKLANGWPITARNKKCRSNTTWYFINNGYSPFRISDYRVNHKLPGLTIAHLKKIGLR